MMIQNKTEIQNIKEAVSEIERYLNFILKNLQKIQTDSKIINIPVKHAIQFTESTLSYPICMCYMYAPIEAEILR